MLIDTDKDLYATVQEVRQQYGFSHINVVIRNPAGDGYHLRNLRLNVTSQFGGDSGGERNYSYAHQYSMESGYHGMGTAELKAAVKVMTKIDRHMSKMYEELGNPANFAEFAARVIKGAGVKTVHFMHYKTFEYDTRHESVYRTTNGGIGVIRERIRKMESELIELHIHDKH